MTMTDDTMSSDIGSYGARTLTALFDTAAEAQRAVQRLRDAGVSDSAVRLTEGNSDYSETTYADQQKGFWESLGDFFFPDEDRYTYAEGLSRGAHMVTVSGYDAAHYDTIVDILDDEGSVDLSQRETEWQTSGSYTGYRDSSYYDEDRSGVSSAAAGMGAAAAAAGGMPMRGTTMDENMSTRDAGLGETRMASDVAMGSSTSSETERSSVSGTSGLDAMDTDMSDDGTVKVMEERLSVGKRDVEMGSVRVRSYVREEPVTADVNLTATRVYLERRPVDRAVRSGDLDFQDRTIEAREHAEQATVSKEARVVEEIGLRKETESHVETVSDTVRKTEVEIEDERTGETTRVTGEATFDSTRDRT